MHMTSLGQWKIQAHFDEIPMHLKLVYYPRCTSGVEPLLQVNAATLQLD